MLWADGFNSQNLAAEGDFFIGDDPDNLCMDLDRFYAILNEESYPSNHQSPSSLEDPSYESLFQSDFAPVAVNHENSAKPQNGFEESMVIPPAEAMLPGSAPWLGTDSSMDETYLPSLLVQGELDTSLRIDSNLSLSYRPENHSFVCLSQSSSEHAGSSHDSAGSSMNVTSNNINNQHVENETPNWDTLSKMTVEEGYLFSNCDGSVNLINIKKENGFRHIGGESLSEMEVRESANDSNFARVSHNSMLHKKIIDSSNLLFDNLGMSYGTANAGCTTYLGAQQRNACMSPIDAAVIDAGASVPNSPHSNPDSGQGADSMRKAIDHCTPPSFFRDFPAGSFPDIYFGLSLLPSETLVSNYGQTSCMMEEDQDQLHPSQSTSSSSQMKLEEDEKALGIFPSSVSIKNLNESLQDIPSTEMNSHHDINFKCEASRQCSPRSVSRNSPSNSGDGLVANNARAQFLHGFTPSLPCKGNAIEMEGEEAVYLLGSHGTPKHFVKDSDEAIQKNCSGESSQDDSDEDVCILEEMSNPRYQPVRVVQRKSHATSQLSTFSSPLHHLAMGGTRLRTSDERLTLQVALQDLSQIKTEASPPDGVMAVPLLKHQRIALSWMVQKETTSVQCSGGILADDQGLGKTISTIALILSERSPSSKVNSQEVKQGQLEALNLDEDDDAVLELGGMKHVRDSDHVLMNSRQMKSENTFMSGKGRPAGGTLVVCPTSVLRQWAEELDKKVTSKANLSVLVYHGTNRTKDPNELARYDVVLTTYSIVSMEVPKQPLVDQDDEEKGKPGDYGGPIGPSTGRKRKYHPSSDKKSLKDKKGIDGVLLESVARPLARVGWFRVILDEAQSIKNHRTQVARACWGLRAKRRWCLSGTPIQNAIDDLYSYFRFLRYDPYAAYKSFCSSIKVPITRNPTNGYRKLQAVLKTIMLRRTKGTLLDGEPIINLPPKVVSLKKVDFSSGEREFYSRLEADSRAQFKVYADAGTIKQNYVNILLMLLRLRQACDHPLLVKGYDSSSVWRSSVETAKKLPREKQTQLLNCLEVSLAICNICNDPPEDAVVTICGHVFCNQCICEHLTGDDGLCPGAHCKVHLSITSVFSKATLKSSLSDQPIHDCSPDNSGSGLFKSPEIRAQSMSDSSKIKAALEILQSLSKTQDCLLQDNASIPCVEFSVSQDNTSVGIKGGSNDMCDGSHLDTGKGLNAPIAAKAIVFSQWTRMLDLLEVPLKNSSIQYRRLDGTMSVVARDKAVKDFNTLPEVSVMIMSLKAASLGLNMVAACHVVLLDLWWNPTTEDQAIDRAHRIGQTRPVAVSRLTVKDTVEDRILALQEKKREMVASAFGEDETGRRQTRLTVEDLEYLFMA